MSVCLIALIALIALVYWPGLGGGFVFDDFPNIVDNTALHVTTLSLKDWSAAIMSSPASSLQRPVAMLTFAVNHYYTGLDPGPMKLTNILIHALNALLVFGLIRSILLFASRDSGDDASRPLNWIALFVAACWALHPINLMAVLFVVQRMESLCHAFVFAGLWFYVAGRRRQIANAGGWAMMLVGLLPFTVLGLLAKESAALLPLYAFVLELTLFRFRGSEGRRDARLYGLYFVVLILPAILGLIWLLPSTFGAGAFGSRTFTLSDRLLTEPRVVLTYLRWTLVPDINQLSLYHDDYRASRGLWDPPSTTWALLAVAALLGGAWRYRHRRPLLSLGLFWFFSAQMLTATIIPLELVFEHRNYFASLGVCLALADALLLVPAASMPRMAGVLLAAVFLVFGAVTTRLRALEWSSEVRFSISEAIKHPQSPRATYDYARTMVILTGYQADSPLTSRTLAALEQARRVPNSGVLPDQATLMFFARTHRPLQSVWWQDMYDKLIRRPIGPQELASIGALTKCVVEKHCDFPRDAMMKLFAAALSHGDHAEVLNMYADYALNVLADPELALRLWQESCKLRPGEPQYRINLIRLLISERRYAEAREQIAALRAQGKIGQNEAAAESLEQRMPVAAAIPRQPAAAGTR